MNPITFPEQNMTLTKPASMTDEQCSSMGVHATNLSTGPVCISCWKMGFWERVRVLFTGKVWAWVMSAKNAQPPIALGVDFPFGKH